MMMTIYKRLIMTTSPFILEFHDNDRDNHYQLAVSVILTYITLSWFNQVIYLMKRVCLWMYCVYVLLGICSYIN
jgi:Ca2+/Na+ antiporter